MRTKADISIDMFITILVVIAALVVVILLVYRWFAAGQAPLEQLS